MKKKKRNAVGLVSNPVRYKASVWLYNNKDTAFNNPILTEAVGLDPMSRNDCNKVYQDVICYWRNGFIEYYKNMKKAGRLEGYDCYQAWDNMLYNYNQNDAYVFLYDRKLGCYLQPGFKELENMDRKRLERQWHGIGTVIEEMQLFDASLVLSSGERVPIKELLKAGKKVDGLLDGNAD